MKEGPKHLDVALVAYEEAAEAAQPGDGAFDNPSVPVAAELAAILKGFALAVSPVRADEVDATALETLSQGVAVVGLVGDDAQGLALAGC